MKQKIIRKFYLLLAFIIALPSISARVDCADNIVFAYYDFNNRRLLGPYPWEDVLNALRVPNQPNGFTDTDFCLPNDITYTLSNDYSVVSYIMIANSKYVKFRWDKESHEVLAAGPLSEFRDESGITIPLSGQNPDAITSVILSSSDTGRNYMFMSQGNTFTTLEYRPDLNSYARSAPVNIAEHFRNMGKPVPPGFERFNAVGEAYDLNTGLITYWVINDDGTRYSFFGPRNDPFTSVSKDGRWSTGCDSSVEDCSACRDNYCSISRIKNAAGEQIFSRIFAVTPVTTQRYTADIFVPKYAYLYYVAIGIASGIGAPRAALVDCPDDIVFAYYDYNTRRANGPYPWEDVLNALGVTDPDFCLPNDITYLLSNDYSRVKYMMTAANSKYATFTWDSNEIALVEGGTLADIRLLSSLTDDDGNIILPSNMQNPDAMTSVVLFKGTTSENRNFIFMSQGNSFTTLQYRPDLSSERPYFYSEPKNIAEQFQRIGQPVPPGFDRFGALGEAYDLTTGAVTYWVINGDGTRYSFFGLRGGAEPITEQPGRWSTGCDSSVEDCSACRDNYCPISRIRNAAGEQIFSSIIAVTPFSTQRATADIFTTNYAYLYYLAVGRGAPLCNRPGNYYDSVSCGSNSMRGDVNQDGLIEYRDACTILRNIGGTASCCLDVNNDRSITSADALQAMLIASRGGTNPERCGGCGRNSCNLCPQSICRDTGCAWRNNACYSTCSVEGQLDVECATGSYCSNGHCCPVGQVWDSIQNRCIVARFGGPCSIQDSNLHTPYSPTNPRYRQACCYISNEAGIRNEYRYLNVETY